MTNIEILKDKHQNKIIYYSEQIRKFIAEYGNEPCDYLNYRIAMENYHRGAYNVLIELERMGE